MKAIPKGQSIIGRVVDIEQSKGGIELPSASTVNVTVLLLVDAVGPQVERCKVGDVILFRHMNHAFFRDGTHLGVVQDTDVYAVIQDLDLERIVVEGENKRVDGRPKYDDVPTPAPVTGRA